VRCVSAQELQFACACACIGVSKRGNEKDWTRARDCVIVIQGDRESKNFVNVRVFHSVCVCVVGEQTICDCVTVFSRVCDCLCSCVFDRPNVFETVTYMRTPECACVCKCMCL